MYSREHTCRSCCDSQNSSFLGIIWLVPQLKSLDTNRSEKKTLFFTELLTLIPQLTEHLLFPDRRLTLWRRVYHTICDIIHKMLHSK